MRDNSSIIVIGGSNSMLTDGWPFRLRLRMPKSKIVNLAIGNTNSVMGYYRLTSYYDLESFDAVVWEYAINDEAQIDRGSLDLEFCLKYVELTIKKTISIGAKFIPIVFEARDHAVYGRESSYKDGLMRLFEKYGIQTIDVTDIYCRKYASDTVKADQYRDRVHYRSNSETLFILIERFLEILASRPHAIRLSTELFQSSAKHVLFCNEFTGGSRHNFRNSAIEITLFRPEPYSSLLSKTPPGNWVLRGLVLLRNRGIDVIRISSTRGKINVNMFHANKRFLKPLVGLVGIPLARNIMASDRAPIRIEYVRRIQRVKLEDDALESAVDSGVVALHFEEFL